MSKDVIYGVIRHVVGAAGAVAVALGIADSDAVAEAVKSVEVIIGAVGVIVAFATSVWAKIGIGK